MSNEIQADATERFAIPATEVARLLSVSERHVWQLNSRGRIPQPFRLGHAVRWSLDEIRAWQAAGAPTRDKWDQMKSANERGKR